MVKGYKLAAAALSVASVLYGLPAMAQPEPESDSVFTLGEIIVSEEHKVSDVTISNSISADKIAMIGAKTAADALDYIPGVHVAQSSKGERFMTMQGFEQDKILILLDGVPYYETNYGQLDLNQIPASIIAKIEVTKGASSVLYGPNGMGGIVNIITKQGQQGISGSLSAAVGQYGHNTESATISVGKNGFSLFGAVEHRGRDAVRMSNDYEPQLSVIRDFDNISGLPKEVIIEDGGKRENSHLESTNVWLRSGYSDVTSELYVSVFNLDTERGLAYNTRSNKVFSDFSSFADIPKYRDSGVDISGRQQLNDWLTLRGMGYYHTHEDNYRAYTTPAQEILLAESAYNDYTAGGALFLDAQLAHWHRLSFSVNYKNDVHKKKSDAYLNPEESHGYQRSQLDTLSFAIEDNIQWGHFNLVTGLAWHQQTVAEDQNTQSNGNNDADTFDPMIGLSYQTAKLGHVYASIAQKTRFATFSEMYDRSVGKVHDLKPERSLSYNLGWEKALNEYAVDSISISLFYHDIQDKIESSQDELGNDIYGNIGQSELYGVEFTTLSQLTEQLSLELDYTYTHARNLSENRDSDFFRDVPQNALTAILNWYHPVWDIDANIRARYKNNILIRDYDNITKDRNVWEDKVLTLDMGVRKHFTFGLSVYANVNNLLDEFHFDGYGQPNDGRSFEIGVDYRF